VGVLFKPWGLRAFTRMDAAALQDQSLPPEEVLVRKSGNWPPTCPRRGRLPIFARPWKPSCCGASRGRPLPPYLAGCMAHLERSPLADNVVNNLAQQSGVAAKTLIGHFKQHVGLTPAKYHHLVVLNRTLRHLAHHPTQTLTQTAYALGFFDQAHLIRFFGQYTGLTPSAYLRAGRLGQVHAANPNAIALHGG
jgi:AraC-like DNA-binding protein